MIHFQTWYPGVCDLENLHHHGCFKASSIVALSAGSNFIKLDLISLASKLMFGVTYRMWRPKRSFVNELQSDIKVA